MKDFQTLVADVEEWAKARDLIYPENASTQLLKAVSELGELCDAEIKGDMNEEKDAVGDVLVCLINYCACKGYDIEVCLEDAYNVISKRKGKTNDNGTFVKE